MTQIYLIFASSLLISVSASAAVTTENVACDSTKEFITSFEFMRADAEMGLGGDISFKYANEVARGCSGAAKRFIQSVGSLRKTDLPLTEVLQTSTELAQKDDVTIDVFNSLFRRLYAQDGFDLDLKVSLDIAKSLSVDYSGSPKTAMQDFEKISAFCGSRNSLELPVRECVEISNRIAQLGGKHEVPVADKFIESYKFLTRSEGVGLTVKEALELSEALLQTHPHAFTNFKQGYEYAISKNGLGADRKTALAFGQKMASATVKTSKTH